MNAFESRDSSDVQSSSSSSMEVVSADAKTGGPHPGSPDSTLEDKPHHGRNFLITMVYYSCLRIAWIFKTESIIMPAVLDVIGGAGWLRGCLPMLNRFGQSLPPLLASDLIRRRPNKKWVLVGSTCCMGACFLALSLVWMLTGGQASWYLPLIFLVIYAIFFTSTGINQLVANTLVGKLILTRRRGLLSLWATVVGAGLAVFSASLILPRWLADGTGEATSRFDLIFALTGILFLISAVVAALLWEESDSPGQPRRRSVQLLRDSWLAFRDDRNFRLLALIVALFGVSLTLFPHYQRLGRDRFELGLTALIPWVIAQNIGAAASSIPAGWAADRFGTRAVLRAMMLVVCIAPVSALWFSTQGASAQSSFILIFGLLGMTPVTMRMFNYYTLEIVERDEHPRYLSTLSIAMALPPVLLSPLMGGLIDWISFEFVFGLCTACLLVGWILTFFLVEPRHDRQPS